VQVFDRGQQLAGQTMLGYESVYQVQRLFRNAAFFGEQDDGCMRPEPPQFHCDFLTVPPGHEVVKNDNVNRMAGSQLQSLGPAGSRQYGITKGFEECPLAFQRVLVIVDAED
jgi:hypothetical protein